ncbi:hypothetical protein RJ639_042270 [Escallonia herrerae]|uniref:PORR domain-containing protein n=1 Tax=Escallonia herrerae TaxID=1293975 RepID=A0AA88WIY2_9ASTE|nr:hypothetical protein RJ639_042270 [Escallonia herrerae]
MATQILKKLTSKLPMTTTRHRTKTSSSHYVATRARDPTFEKHMDAHKNLLKVVAVQDLLLAAPTPTPTTHPPSLSVDFLDRLSQKLHLNRGATAFLRHYPHIFHVFYNPTKSQPYFKLTESATKIAQQEAAAVYDSLPLVIDRLVRLLSMSLTKTLPLRAIFKVWRELGLPDDFEDSVISRNPNLFALCDAEEPNTHIFKLVDENSGSNLVAAVENWRVIECCGEGCSVDRTEIRSSFKHGYPPGMRLGKNFKAKVKEWQGFAYVGPYEEMGEKRRTKSGVKALEKRAVGVVHEFLSLTVEKTVEVEKISHFRKWFGIDLNIRDLFLDHPGMFYLSTKGKRHTVFLREAYEKGRLLDPNPVYEARRKLLDLVVLGRRGVSLDSKSRNTGQNIDRGLQEQENN